MPSNLYSKYVTHATVVLDNPDMEENLSILEDVFDEKINVCFPLTVVLAERSFKIKDRDALNTFINAAQAMAELCDAIANRKIQQAQQYSDTIREINTKSERYVFREYPDGFGVSKTDEIMPPNWLC